MKRPLVHVVGAGVSGLVAAHRLAASGRCDVIVHEARAYPGGRRRSFHDEAFGGDLDTGNFPLLSGWKQTWALIEAIGAAGRWRKDKLPGVAFADLVKGTRWRLTPNAGRIPWWLLLAARRGPGLTPADYWPAWKLMFAGPDQTLKSFAPTFNNASDLLWRPLSLAALNAEPEAASAKLAGQVVREALLAGGRGFQILLPESDIGRALIDPLARSVGGAGALLRFDRKLVGLRAAGGRVVALDFESDRVEVGPQDGVILATPWATAAGLVPGLAAPTGASMSMTVHFAIPSPQGAPLATGVINGPFDWLFSYRDRLSVTIRDAKRRIDSPREAIAAECWAAVAALTKLSDSLPAWRIVPSRRSGGLASPEETRRRPGRDTQFANLFLAGGHVSPFAGDSIEGAVHSGAAAAEVWLRGRG